MIKSNDIIEFLETLYDPDYAESWDNSGIQVGRNNVNVKKVFVTLDCTTAALEKAIALNADMIITHHPMIFAPLKKITDNDIFGSRIIELIKNDIVLYSAHTNYDVAKMAKLNAKDAAVTYEEPLSIEGFDADGVPYGTGFIGHLDKKIPLAELASALKDKYNLEYIRVYGDPDKEINKVAMCSGSGKSFINDAVSKEADVYITGDVDHHSAIDAVMNGIAVIDGGHYGTEFCFIKDVANEIRKRFDEVEVTEDEITQPFFVI